MKPKANERINENWIRSFPEEKGFLNVIKTAYCSQDKTPAPPKLLKQSSIT